jgi:outer membrane lipoprotein LolB
LQVNAPDQSFSAAFELQGNAQQGSLLLLTPLGTTAARVRWTAALTTLQSGGETREFPDLQTLINHLLGTDVPVTALFAWLDGQQVEIDGWQVDLTQRTEGKITARRLMPQPMAELRLVLED